MIYHHDNLQRVLVEVEDVGNKLVVILWLLVIVMIYYIRHGINYGSM